MRLFLSHFEILYKFLVNITGNYFKEDADEQWNA